MSSSASLKQSPISLHSPPNPYKPKSYYKFFVTTSCQDVPMLTHGICSHLVLWVGKSNIVWKIGVFQGRGRALLKGTDAFLFFLRQKLRGYIRWAGDATAGGQFCRPRPGRHAKKTNHLWITAENVENLHSSHNYPIPLIFPHWTITQPWLNHQKAFLLFRLQFYRLKKSLVFQRQIPGIFKESPWIIIFT